MRLPQTLLFSGLLLFSPAIWGCGSEQDDCQRSLLPHLSPVSFGEMYAQGNRDPNYLSPDRTPYEWNLILSASGCEVEITEVCLAGDTDAVRQFELEGPVPDRPRRGVDGVVRVTYDRQTPHSGGASDQVALVVQSNADNFPTLIVPICARVVEDGESRGQLECNSPVTVEPGQRDTSLCGG